MDVLEIKNITYRYTNSSEKILSSINQKFQLGKFYAIIGKSGAGKSTLLSLLAGLDKPQTGKVLFKNKKAYIQAGAGIVYDSVPEKEFCETQNKAKAMINAIEEATAL